MKINWKVRLQSGSFWMGIASAVVAAVFSILSLCGVSENVGADQVMQAITLILMIPASIGIISDPTTKGLGDSQRALAYTKPRDDSQQENSQQ